MVRTKNPSVRDGLRFLNNEAEMRYTQFSRRKVEGGRLVNLADLAIFDVERAFGDMGWLPVISYEACTCPGLVRQFYCNLQVIGDHNDVDRGHELRITSYVKGVQISFDYRQLGDLLGIPYDGDLVYGAPGDRQFLSLELKAHIDDLLLQPGQSEMKACFLRPSPRVYCKVIQHNLVPQGGHYERVSQLVQYLLLCICTREPVCLPYIIMRTMISATLPGYDKGNLPYGRMITRMLASLGVDLANEELQEKSFSVPLDWEAIGKMGLQDAQVSDEERNAMVRPSTRVQMADAAAAAAARAQDDPCDEIDRMFMDMNDLFPPAVSTPAAGASTSFHADPSPGAEPPSSPSDELLSLLRGMKDAQLLSYMRLGEIQRSSDSRMSELLDAQRASNLQMAELLDAQRVSNLQMAGLLDAQRRSDQRVADLTASLQATQTQVAWLTRVYAEDYDRDREAPPPPDPPVP